MPTINVTVRNRIATAQRWQCIICGNSDYIVDFDLDAEWNDMPNKVAVSELKPETSAPLHRRMSSAKLASLTERECRKNLKIMCTGRSSQ